MNVKRTIQKQCQRIVDEAAERLAVLLNNSQNPSEGWIVVIRKALGMSGAQLARSMGISRAAISQREKSEPDGSVTLKQMQLTAEALGCRFVYAIVPDKDVKTVIRKQALQKARSMTKRASAHMALESQSLSLEANEEIIEETAEELIRSMPSDFWDKT